MRLTNLVRKKSSPLVIAWVSLLIISIFVQAPEYNWKIDSWGQNYFFNSVTSSPEKDVWAVGGVLQPGGNTGAIFRLVGENWFRVSGPSEQELSSIHMRSSTEGWAIGDGGSIIKWDGSSWAAVASPTTNNLASICGVSDAEGWAVGERGTILRWENAAWSLFTSPTENNLNSVYILSSNYGVAVGNGGTILKWDGSSWSVTSSPTNNNLNSVFMLSASDGWAAGDNGTILRWGGSGWSVVDSPTTKTLKEVFAISSGEAWAVGSSGGIGILLRWDGRGWLALGTTIGEINTIRMLSSTEGWAAGDAILRWGESKEKTYPDMFFIVLWIAVLHLLVRDSFVKGQKKNSRLPILTLSLITVNILIFEFVGSSIFTVTSNGLRPAEVLQGQGLHSLITSMFLHGSYSHLGGNMLFLLVFGTIAEKLLGSKKFLLIYFISGFTASAAHIASAPGELIPAIGASGAIAGVLGACAVLNPPVKAPAPMLILLIAPLFTFFLHPIAAPVMSWAIIALALYLYGREYLAFPFLFVWVFYQVGMGILVQVGWVSMVAYWAHIGGFAGGVWIYLLFNLYAWRKEGRQTKKLDIPPIG